MGSIGSILWSTVFLVSVGALLVGIRIFRILSDLKEMTPVDSGEIFPGIYVIRDSYVNLYLVRGKSAYIAIDSGIDPQVVRDELKKLNIDPAEIAAVFLTHSDADHTGGLSVFAQARILLSKEEEQMVDGRTARILAFKNRRIPEHELLQDGQIVNVDGHEVIAILTPGHTPGAVSYRVGGENLFVGDSMRLQGAIAGIFSQSINMDSAVQLQSLKKLARLEGVRHVFTAHFGYTDDFGRAFEPFR